MEKTKRRSPYFDLSDPKQKKAYEFLGIVEREQAVYISELICDFLDSRQVEAVSELTKDDVRRLFKKNKENKENDIPYTELEANIRNIVKQMLAENSCTDIAEKIQKAHDEPSNETTTEITLQKENNERTVLKDDENEAQINEDLLSGLDDFF